MRKKFDNSICRFTFMLEKKDICSKVHYPLHFYPAMKLEEAIKQKSFKTERQKALINIMYTQSWVEERIEQFLKVAEITSQQFNVLRILRGSINDPLSTSEIRSRMLDRMSDTSRIVERMVQKGLVSRAVSAKDKRLVEITITQKGLDTLSVLDTQETKLEGILDTLDDDEIEALNLILDKIRGKV